MAFTTNKSVVLPSRDRENKTAPPLSLLHQADEGEGAG